MASRPSWRNGNASNSNSSTTPPPPSSNTNTQVAQVSSMNNSDNSTELALASPSIPSLGDQHPHFGSLDPLQATAMVFFETVNDFASASHEVWPNDAIVKKHAKRLSKIKSMNQKVQEGIYLASSFHESLSSQFPKILEKNPAAFDHPVFDSISSKEKFSDCSTSVQATVWEYLKNLVQYSNMLNMYKKCPSGVLSSISAAAGGIVSKLQSGEMDMNSLNPLAIGQAMMKDLKPEELESFGNSLMGDMDGMMSMMQSMLETNAQNSGGNPQAGLAANLMQNFFKNM